MEALRHPELGYVVLRAAECEALVAYLQAIDDALLLSTGRDYAWLAGRTGYLQDAWMHQACKDEWRRRQAMQHVPPPDPAEG